MSDLRDAFKVAGCKDVSTYIQSGNVIFESPEEDSAAMFRKIRVKLRDLFGSEPGILFRTVRDLEGIVRAAPFRDFHAEPGIKLYVAFLAEKTRTRPRFPLVSAKEALEAIEMKSREVFIVSRRKQNGFTDSRTISSSKSLESRRPPETGPRSQGWLPSPDNPKVNNRLQLRDSASECPKPHFIEHSACRSASWEVQPRDASGRQSQHGSTL
jgi:uncharacterized protein (DUF1697 family)